MEGRKWNEKEQSVEWTSDNMRSVSWKKACKQMVRASAHTSRLFGRGTHATAVAG